MNKFLRHFNTITKHKLVVGYYCIKCGQTKRGLLHDNSKYSLTEFKSSAKYFQGNSSPIDAEKAAIGYSFAWQHHKGHNPHHWEYWIDNVGTKKNTPIRMPYNYLIEMLCDWIGAGKVYSKEKWNQAEPYNFFMTKESNMILDKETKKVVILLLEVIRDYGLDVFCDLCKHPIKSSILYKYKIEDIK